MISVKAADQICSLAVPISTQTSQSRMFRSHLFQELLGLCPPVCLFRGGRSNGGQHERCGCEAQNINMLWMCMGLIPLLRKTIVPHDSLQNHAPGGPSTSFTSFCADWNNEDQIAEFCTAGINECLSSHKKFQNSQKLASLTQASCVAFRTTCAGSLKMMEMLGNGAWRYRKPFCKAGAPSPTTPFKDCFALVRRDSSVEQTSLSTFATLSATCSQ